MSAPWGFPDNCCPKCGSADVNPPNEGRWADCNECGFIEYDAETLALQNEVRREQAQAKQILGYVPSYREAVKKGLAK